MEGRLRAIADRVLFDSATVLYVASGVAPGQDGATAEVGGWTVRQVLGHLGAALEGYAAAVERLLAGEALVPPGWDPDALNAAVGQSAGPGIPEAAQRIRDGRARFLAALERIDGPSLDESFRGQSLDGILDSWARHCAAHAFDLLDALPQFRVDPIAVNWALFLDSSGNARFIERQKQLVQELESRLRRDRKEA